MSIRGFQGLQGPQGPTGPTGPPGPSLEREVIQATIQRDTIYLNKKVGQYLLNISPAIVGTEWTIHNILAGTAPSTGIVPDNIFPMFQDPATLFIQNVSGVPISVVFDNSDTDLTYFAFSGDTLSYSVQPLGILIVYLLFTSNSIIHTIYIYNDSSLDYRRMSHVMNNVLAAGYVPTLPPGISTPLLEIEKGEVTRIDISTSYTLDVAAMEKSTAFNAIRLTANGIDLTIDGGDANPDGVLILMILVETGASGTLYTVGLTNDSAPPYNTPSIPLVADKAYFVTILGSNVTVIDGLADLIGEGLKKVMVFVYPELTQLGSLVLGGFSSSIGLLVSRKLPS
jgi:hypothetical protein